MKTLMKWPLILILLIAAACGEDDTDLTLNHSNLEGEWVYNTDSSQSITFIEPGLAKINVHDFTYEISGDEIEFSYSGPLFIAIVPSKHEVSFDDEGNLLRLTNLENLQFFSETASDSFSR